jgi:hypothetical protein
MTAFEMYTLGVITCREKPSLAQFGIFNLSFNVVAVFMVLTNNIGRYLLKLGFKGRHEI